MTRRIHDRIARLRFDGRGAGVIVNPAGTPQPNRLRVSFDVERTITGEPNTARVAVWNLADSTRAQVGREYDAFVLEAGYGEPDGRVGILFAGQVRDVAHSRRPDGSVVTEFSCGDGDVALQRATLATALPAGAALTDAVKQLHDALGLDRGEWDVPELTITRPLQLVGSARDALDELGRSHGFYWSVQNGALDIRRADRAGAGVVHLAAHTGLVDVPVFTDDGAEITCALDPALKPGHAVAVSSALAGLDRAAYRVAALTHSGDTHGGRFVSTIRGEPMRGRDVRPPRSRVAAGGRVDA